MLAVLGLGASLPALGFEEAVGLGLSTKGSKRGGRRNAGREWRSKSWLLVVCAGVAKP